MNNKSQKKFVKDNPEYKLCYVDLPWLYFTTQSLDAQWGDDWDDVPYEHNAGLPYEPCWHNDPIYIDTRRAAVNAGELCKCKRCTNDWNKDGTPKYKIKKVAVDLGRYADRFFEPKYGYTNSPYSVQDINNRKVPWLTDESREIEIWAGQSFDEVISILTSIDVGIYCNQETESRNMEEDENENTWDEQ